MKKSLFFVATMLLSGIAAMAQTPTIVSTQVEKRNVIIEEFTGVNCGYCPDGHRIVNEICEQYAGHAWAINIHQGSYATGSGYTTTYGNTIASLWNVTGWPSGTVNRISLQSRGAWAAKAAEVRSEDSPVNVAAVGHIDEATRTVSLHIEAYYTSNAAETTNLLNVAVLQNNVIGRQSGSGYNPDYVEPDGSYRHMHMFRTLLTGQWGVEIPATQGSFIDTTITYVVPEAIDGLAISDLNDLEFVIFVTRPTHKNILSGAKATIITDAPVISNFKYDRDECSLTFQPYVTINNTTESNFTSFTFLYNDEAYTVNKTINSLQTDTIHMPPYTVNVSGEADQNCVDTMTVQLNSCDDDNSNTVYSNAAAKELILADFHIYTVAGPFDARVGIDAYGSEASVSLLNQSNCQTVWTEGPWTDYPGFNINNVQYITQLPNARYITIKFDPAQSGLYIFRLNDSYGDGWAITNNSVVSGLWVSNAGGEFLAFPQGYTNGESFSTKDFYLNVTSTGDGSHVGIDNVAETVSVSTYPNPASAMATISASSTIHSLEVVNTLGQVVYSNQRINADRYELNVSDLCSGIYFVTVATDKGTATERLSVVK